MKLVDWFESASAPAWFLASLAVLTGGAAGAVVTFVVGVVLIIIAAFSGATCHGDSRLLSGIDLSFRAAETLLVVAVLGLGGLVASCAAWLRGRAGRPLAAGPRAGRC
jgi:hypothetical protein